MFKSDSDYFNRKMEEIQDQFADFTEIRRTLNPKLEAIKILLFIFSWAEHGYYCRIFC